MSGDEKKCDCTHTQACEICAEAKDIDWSLIEGEADEKKLAQTGLKSTTR